MSDDLSDLFRLAQPVAIDPDAEPLVPSKALFTVVFGKPHLLYHQGGDVAYWIDMVGKPETVESMVDPDLGDGLFIWSGYVHSWRCGGEYDEWDSDLKGETRASTKEEWDAFVADEFVWDLDESEAHRNWVEAREKEYREDRKARLHSPEHKEKCKKLLEGALENIDNLNCQSYVNELQRMFEE